jgi:D-serine deaminase-like pyridoxal phosphate-dependent protein
VHLSKEFLVLENEPCYGLVAPITEDGWGTPFQHTWVTRLSQEHGIIRTDPKTFNSIRIGGTLAVLPVHSCLTANLAEQYLTTDGKLLTKIRS